MASCEHCAVVRFPLSNITSTCWPVFLQTPLPQSQLPAVTISAAFPGTLCAQSAAAVPVPPSCCAGWREGEAGVCLRLFPQEGTALGLSPA